jgi:nitroimidazol reductase NimA-like FMN-containing flavoprotein (pyridoxamine 5'-phosphate oxidase superfamily)
MLGELNEKQIEDLLKRQVTGRVACTQDDVPYIVPVNYVFDGKQIISHSTPGKKNDIMRKNPRVCFQVDEIKNIFNWQSVIAWGRFEEITDMPGKEQAMMAITHRIMPFAEKSTDHASHGLAEKEEDIGTRLDLILYRIVLVDKTGRFERNSP